MRKRTVDEIERLWRYEAENWHMSGYHPTPSWFEYSHIDEIWELIRDYYLPKYSAFYRVSIDWTDTFIREILYPGAIAAARLRSPDKFPLHEHLVDRVRDGQRRMIEWADNVGESDDDAATPDLTSLQYEVALELKRLMGESVYVEYQNFREVTLD